MNWREWVVGILFLAGTGWAQSPISLQEAETAFQAGQYALAEQLFSAYLRERTPTDPGADVAAYRAAESALNLDAPARALEYLRHPALEASPLRERAQFREAQAHYRLGAIAAAAEEWRRLRSLPDEELAAAAQLGLVWVEIRQEQWKQAQRELALYHRMFPLRPEFRTTVALSGALARLAVLPYRSPERARWLSTLVPGAGQAYAGRIGNGLGSFLLNAAWIGLTVRAIVHRRWVDAAILFVLGSRFYTGGRENAARFAEEANRRAREAVLAPFRSWEP
ncbi:MAG: hypothetical protein KatS3mg115_0790 [Candidatus Poribacteria bacterium]|nr:MAG: hypothetical protein KatS3mg115_0790 [Candidatus Poribacteria bacterium]